MNVKSAVLAMAVAMGAMGAACGSHPAIVTGAGGSGGGAGGGGSSGGGGSGGAGGSGPRCTSVTPCAGSVAGTWDLTTSCLEVSGSLDLAAIGLGCPTTAVAGSLEVSGTFTANANGS